MAVIEALEPLIPAGNALQCKWPNDILLNERKLGGILLESFRAGDAGSAWAVVGVGINVDSPPAAHRFSLCVPQRSGR